MVLTLQDGYINIHAHSPIPEIEGSNLLIGCGYDQVNYLLCSSLPIKMAGLFPVYPQNYRQRINWVIKNYQSYSKYYEIVFDFSELQYLYPSLSVVKKRDKEVIISLEPRVIKKFTFKVNDIECNVVFRVRADGYSSSANSTIKTLSEICISFSETDDFVFLENVYTIVDCVFAFICNRRNTTCVSMKLVGRYKEDGESKRPTSRCSSEMFFMNQYREQSENDKGIAKCFFAGSIIKYIDKLFHLVASDISRDAAEMANISIASIHPSLSRRNLIDLQQSLHITSAFEFYVRRYLPTMVEEKEYHVVLKVSDE